MINSEEPIVVTFKPGTKVGAFWVDAEGRARSGTFYVVTVHAAPVATPMVFDLVVRPCEASDANQVETIKSSAVYAVGSYVDDGDMPVFIPRSWTVIHDISLLAGGHHLVDQHMSNIFNTVQGVERVVICGLDFYKVHYCSSRLAPSLYQASRDVIRLSDPVAVEGSSA